jgi:SAM-dependent methyltransferase
VIAGDDLAADPALRSAAEGTGLLWRGDYHNARHLLDAMKRRLTRTGRRQGLPAASEFRRQRQDQARMSRLLGSILVEVTTDYALDLRRAPAIDAACHDVFGATTSPAVMSFRELLGVLGAHRWRQRGIEILALNGRRIHPHYGVFAPTRTDYIDLVARTTLPPARTAFDIGTGTGVLAALLLHRRLPRVVATDVEWRAVECAKDNLERLGLADRATVQRRDLFPPGRADLIVCNPPWVPASPTSTLEAGVFDRGSGMLTRFVRQLPDHLTHNGEAWLVISDLPERLGLRDDQMLPRLIESAGLTVRGRSEGPSTTNRRTGSQDPLSAYRSQERIHLWRMARR